MTCGWNYYPWPNKSVEGTTLTLRGKKFMEGVGTCPTSALLINLNKCGIYFEAVVGLDDGARDGGAVDFYVLGDRKILWHSDTMKRGDEPKSLNVDLKGVNQLGLLVTGKIGRDSWADWCDAKIVLTKDVPGSELVPPRDYYILTPKATAYPRINSPEVFGVRPADPFPFRIAASGDRPMKFIAYNLPAGLKLNKTTGEITGVIAKPGQYEATLIAANKLGKAEQKLHILVGKTICLTPPMGWNSWNAFGKGVDERDVHDAAEEMVKTGLIDYGWSYVVVDGGWTVNPDGGDSPSGGRPYDFQGRILPNRKFPNMKGLSNFVHSEGLKFGLHTSPGPGTCAHWAALYGHERHSVEEFVGWGVDFMKYDWCSYTEIARNNSLPELQKPWRLMRAILDTTHRDIVLSINPGPAGRKANPWKWAKDVGANMWRTTGDIDDSWQTVSHIGFSQTHGEYAGPGHWNDPDMLVIGDLGWGVGLHPTKLTPNEQYTQMSLWCLLSAPLMLGCDLRKLDKFTMNLITNSEVLTVDQDPLGEEARCVFDKDGKQIWVKDMQDGSKAVGLFWVGKEPDEPSGYFRWKNDRKKMTMTLNVSQIAIKGKFKVRDLWRQKNLGTFKGKFTAEVQYHGVELIKVTPEK